MKLTGPRNAGSLLTGLSAGALTAVSISYLPAIRFFSWTSLLAGAALRVFLVFLAAFVTSLGIHRNSKSAMPGRAALKPAVMAVWLAPLALLLRQRSIWMLAVVGIFVAIVGMTFYRREEHALVPEGGSAEHPNRPELFSLIESPSGIRQAYVFAAVVCAEAGVMAGASQHLLRGTLLVVTASAVWLYASRETWRYSSSELSRSRAFRAAALAVLFTAIGLLPFLRRGYPDGSGTGRFAAHYRHVSAQTGAGNGEEGYIAIELWPQQQPTPLIAPAPLHKGKNTRGKQSSPLVIPFSGVYWFFKSPDLSLPPKPREAHGSPEMFDIHSTDRHSLSMQAHQNLGTLVDLSCCRSIKIGIRNSDRYPGTVSIELVLTDTTSPGRPAISLGRKLVRSTRPWMLYDHRPPTTEVLEYAVPPNSRIHQFDEVMVIFWLDRDRSFAAAKMGIENFVLVPHGA